MTPTYTYDGYGCIANMRQLSTCPVVKRFESEQVELLVARHLDVLFVNAEGIWITDREAWDRDSTPGPVMERLDSESD